MTTNILKPKSKVEIYKDIEDHMSPVDQFIAKFVYEFELRHYIDLDIIKRLETPNIKVSITNRKCYQEYYREARIACLPFNSEIEINVCDHPAWEGQYQDRSIIIRDLRIIEIKDNIFQEFSRFR